MPFNVAEESDEEIEETIGKEMISLGITQSELKERCNDLFGFTQPIPFKSSQSKLDQKIQEFIKVNDVTIPIVHVKNSQYLIGINKCNCELKANKIMIRVGGGYEKIQDYVSKNNKYFQRALVINMVKSENSLEFVLNEIIKGDKITTSGDKRLSAKSKKSGSKNSSGRNSLLTSPSHAEFLKKSFSQTPSKDIGMTTSASQQL